MPSNSLAMNIVKPCVRVGGSAVVTKSSCLPRKLVDSRQHLSSDFDRQNIHHGHNTRTLSDWTADKRVAGLHTQEPEDLKGVTCGSLLNGIIQIPTVEDLRVTTILELFDLKQVENLSAVQVLLKENPFSAELKIPTTEFQVPAASAAPVALISDVEIIEEPSTEEKSFSGSSQIASSPKTERRRRAKTKAKLTQLSMTRRLDDFQERLKKNRMMAVSAEMQHQQQLVIRAWAAVSARIRRDAVKQRQLGDQRKMYALRAMQARLGHEKQLVLRSWSAVAADSLKTRTHQQELDAFRNSTDSSKQYVESAWIAHDCPFPPGLWNSETSAIADDGQSQSSNCSACLSNWGCLQHSVYSSRLFLAQREIGMKISRGPPGLVPENEVMEVPSSHLHLAPLDQQATPLLAHRQRRKTWRQKQARG